MLSEEKRKEIIDELENFCKCYPNSKWKLNDFEDRAIYFKDPELSLWFLKNNIERTLPIKSKLIAHADIILNFGNLLQMIDAFKYVLPVSQKLINERLLAENNAEISRVFVVKYFYMAINNPSIKIIIAGHLANILKHENILDNDDLYNLEPQNLFKELIAIAQQNLKYDQEMSTQEVAYKKLSNLFSKTKKI